LVFLNPQPSDEELSRIYSAQYFLGSETVEGRSEASQIKQATGKEYLSEIVRYRGEKTGRLLEIGCGEGDLLELAEAHGWEVTGIEYSATACNCARQRLKRGEVHQGELPPGSLPAEQFDLCVLSDVLEHVRRPLDFLRETHRVLKPGGTLFIATPSTDSWSARLLRQNWMEFKTEHLVYFDRETLQTALIKAGFDHLVVQPGWKILSLDYIGKHFERFPVPMITPAVKLLNRILPKSVRRRPRRIVASGVRAFARKAIVRSKCVLSVIVPVYNEAKTFGVMMERLLHKEIPGLQTEIIVVESNSTDGSREAALKFKDHPNVQVVLEEQPLGKGHAVRTGLRYASGDYVLIQDADLEYDFEDYDALLGQLVGGTRAFVLGSRHGGRRIMKMRQFTGQRSLSLFMNAGHWFFTALINILFFQRFRDPFTMFKVFRRDCLFGLEFECNRFDFDFELLIKLVRKGYRPIELPVNYRSRSHKEGKKVRIFRDPISWLKALIRLRFVRIDPMKVVERTRDPETLQKNRATPDIPAQVDPGKPASSLDKLYYQHSGKLKFARRISVVARRHVHEVFMQRMRPRPEDRILDIGATDDSGVESNMLEQLYPYRERLTCASLSDGKAILAAYPGVQHVQVTAAKPLPFADNAFDIVYCNAVLEHVGSRERQREFMRELCRVAPRRFVVVPNRRFPIEHHTCLPLIHYLPKAWFRKLLRGTRYDAWSHEENLNFISTAELRTMWPDKDRPTIVYAGIGAGSWKSNLVAYQA
jgi:2-polyprenyl-3-methyl-5-hydroxy-6-metoxy-1,4-benzoquinol methylase/glycosyltransferase involved in cell wall biosynthesis